MRVLHRLRRGRRLRVGTGSKISLPSKLVFTFVSLPFNAGLYLSPPTIEVGFYISPPTLQGEGRGGDGFNAPGRVNKAGVGMGSMHPDT